MSKSIGELEKLAGITDRKSFWVPFAAYEDGYQRGVRTLQYLASAQPQGRTAVAHVCAPRPERAEGDSVRTDR